MADVTLTGRFGAVLENAALLIADAAAFRAWTGTGNQALALGRVSFVTDLDSNWTRPRVLIWFGPEIRLVRDSAGGGSSAFPKWTELMVHVRFEAL